MSESEQYDYPVSIDNDHVVGESVHYEGDKFMCHTGAYLTTGAWPTFNYCPYCGAELDMDD